jgi:hypothetical protein
VGPPPPGATRGLGVILASYRHPAVYASQRPLSMIIFDGGVWRLFTQVRGIGILRTSPFTISPKLNFHFTEFSEVRDRLVLT